MAIPNVLLQLAKSNPRMSQIKQMMNAVKTAQNPQAALNQMIMNNPNFKQVMDIINQHGGNVGEAVNATAAQMGISPQDIMNLLN